ncbi:MAG: sugar ABC transporter ATP-binding protein [Candidatus Hinthialibacter antarcticus]|nr:sugar ABC transporter ATP-binding protein [Candidatus Hinthialibacter antarcticus]
MNHDRPFLQMNSICKRYPGVRALHNVSLNVRAGEAHALIGENGAGKSTLMKILAGAEHANSGEILIEGEPTVMDTPLRAREAGVSIIYQEFNLIPHLNAAENIFLGREPTRFGFVSFREEHRRAQALFDRLGVDVPLNVPVLDLSVAQQQMIEIAKALAFDCRLIAMDEPSAALTPQETAKLFELVATLKAQGVGVIYISHRLEEIFQICERITVLRDGEFVGTWPVSELDRDAVIEKMVGRKLEDEFPKEVFSTGKEILRVEELSRGRVQDVSFSINQGEIVALTGLMGAGRTEVARMIFGADKHEAGRIFLDNREVCFRTPREAIDQGVCLLTEDRKAQGLILGMKIRENATLPKLKEFCRFGLLSRQMEHEAAHRKLKDLQIKAPSVETEARALSGGNQQKVVLAKWLLANSRLFIFDEPTRGVDVGAKREIYLLMNDLLRRGAGILMISSELPEVLGMADRIIVLCEGRIEGELSRQDASQEGIMQLATRRTASVTA